METLINKRDISMWDAQLHGALPDAHDPHYRRRRILRALSRWLAGFAGIGNCTYS